MTRDSGRQSKRQQKQLETMQAGVHTVKIFDPCNKEGYDLVSGGPDSEVFPTVGLAVYFQQRREGGTKRVFLCKKFQMGSCRAKEQCNSVHASVKRVKELRAQFGETEKEFAVWVWSEGDKQVFDVPLSSTAPTAGRNIGAGVLCRDYDMGSCVQKERCPYIHVAKRIMTTKRGLWNTTCCGSAECGALSSTHNKYPLARGQPWTGVVMYRCELPRDMLAVTKGLEEVCSMSSVTPSGLLEIPQNKLCRPHLRSECKWQGECKNVHLCRVRCPQPIQKPPSRPPARTREEVLSKVPQVKVVGAPLTLPCVLSPYLPQATAPPSTRSDCSGSRSPGLTSCDAVSVTSCDSSGSDAEHSEEVVDLGTRLVVFASTKLPPGGVHSF